MADEQLIYTSAGNNAPKLSGVFESLNNSLKNFGDLFASTSMKLQSGSVENGVNYPSTNTTTKNQFNYQAIAIFAVGCIGVMIVAKKVFK